jgi:hypothetical protein
MQVSICAKDPPLAGNHILNTDVEQKAVGIA